MGLTKAQLEALNISSFPNNNEGDITPEILRNYNSASIANNVNQDAYTTDSASFNTRINALTSSVTSAITGSSLITASFDNATRNLTFTKGNATTFNVNIPDVSGSTFNTASFATTGSNTFVGNQNISGSIFFPNGAQLKGNTGGATELYSNITALTLGSVVNTNITGSSVIINNVDFIPFSASLNTRILAITGSGGSINTGSFATTGSNTFTGDQTWIDNANNFYTITDASGSMMLVAKGYTSSSLHLSSSVSAVGSGSLNIIFKTNNNTADTIISGSGNIFLNPVAPTAGFKRYLTSNNIALGAGFAQISESMQFSPNVTNNYFGQGSLTMRGPASASAWTVANNNLLGSINIGQAAGTVSAEKLTSTLTMTGNYVAGTFSVNAGVTALTASTVTVSNNNINGAATLTLIQSAVNFTGNSVNDGAFQFNNNYFSSSAGLGFVSLQRNTIAGNTNTITITGSVQATTTSQPQFNDNLIGGGANTIFSDYSNSRISAPSTFGNFHRSIVYGNTLIVTASMSAGDGNSQGSAFFGRFNVNDGIRNKSDYAVFSVGTGNGTTRKTGFLIDSGSNSFFEGSLNVSGSTSLTGSLTIQSGSSFFANGNRQFNVGAFSSLVSQSGSANVSPSMNFGTTDISQGVSIASNSRITLANSGTYNLQFSAQVDRVSGSGTDVIYIWLKKNGTNVSNTAGAVTVTGGAAAAKVLASWNYVVDAAAGDYYELCWQSPDANIVLTAIAASGNIPLVPSVILTVTQVR